MVRVTFHWSHKLTFITSSSTSPLQSATHLKFNVSSGSLISSDSSKSTIQESTDHSSTHTTTYSCDFVVGADGVNSISRKFYINDELHRLGYASILGISPKLDQGIVTNRVYQAVDGTMRLFGKPFSTQSAMWQLSFPLKEIDQKELASYSSQQLSEYLNKLITEANWHSLFHNHFLSTTEPLKFIAFKKRDPWSSSDRLLNNITLIGDAAHPMTPFCGMGMNTGIVDAFSLGSLFTSFLHSPKLSKLSTENQKQNLLVTTVIDPFETEMMERGFKWVNKSLSKTIFLHTKDVYDVKLQSDFFNIQDSFAMKEYTNQINLLRNL